MKKYKVVIVQTQLVCIIPTILQTSFCIGPQWLVEEDGSYRGLVSKQLKDSVTVDYNVPVLDDITLGLQLCATVLLWIHLMTSLVTSIYILHKYETGARCRLKLALALFYLSILLYILSSFFILAGCIYFASIFPLENIRSSFFDCLSVCLWIWLVVCIYIIDQICKRKREKNVFHTLLFGLSEKIAETSAIP